MRAEPGGAASRTRPRQAPTRPGAALAKREARPRRLAIVRPGIPTNVWTATRTNSQTVSQSGRAATVPDRGRGLAPVTPRRLRRRMRTTTLAMLLAFAMLAVWSWWGIQTRETPPLPPRALSVQMGASAAEVLPMPTRTDVSATEHPHGARRVASAPESTRATPTTQSSPPDPQPSLVRYRRVQSELLEHIRSRWTRAEFTEWLRTAHPASDDREPVFLRPFDADLIHDCATFAMARTLMAHVTEFRDVERRLALSRVRPETSPGSRDRQEARIAREDAVLSALHAGLARLNADLSSGTITLRILKVGNGNFPEGPVVFAVNHDESSERIRCVFQSGPWHLTLSAPQSHWSQPIRDAGSHATR